jgi:hypothetical protein
LGRPKTPGPLCGALRLGFYVVIPVSMSTEDRTDLVSLRMPADLRETIEREAKQEHRTFSGHLRFLICVAIETRAAGPQQHREA